MYLLRMDWDKARTWRRIEPIARSISGDEPSGYGEVSCQIASGGYFEGQQLRLHQYRMHCRVLHVRWITVLAQGTANQHSEPGLDAFFDGPVDAGIPAHAANQLSCDHRKLHIPQHVDCALVLGQSVVESQIVLGKSQLFLCRVILPRPVITGRLETPLERHQGQ